MENNNNIINQDVGGGAVHENLIFVGIDNFFTLSQTFAKLKQDTSIVYLN